MLAALAIPAFLPPLFAIVPRRADIQLAKHLRMLAGDLRLAALQVFFSLAFLPDQAWRMADAIVPDAGAAVVTRRHLLEWTTAAQSAQAPRLDLRGFYRQMAGGTALGLAMAAGALLFAPSSWPLVLPFALLWLAAPALALWASRSPRGRAARRVSTRPRRDELAADRAAHLALLRNLRHAGRQHAAAGQFPGGPQARRSRTALRPPTSGCTCSPPSPRATSAGPARCETVERLEATFASLQQLTRFKGHFYNWYGTLDLQPLAPAYVSSVDSGNLAGHLIVLANACEEWIAAPLAADARAGVADNLRLAREAMAALPAASGEAGRAARRDPGRDRRAD